MHILTVRYLKHKYRLANQKGKAKENSEIEKHPVFYAMVSAIFLLSCHFIGLPAR